MTDKPRNNPTPNNKSQQIQRQSDMSNNNRRKKKPKKKKKNAVRYSQFLMAFAMNFANSFPASPWVMVK